jgi:hypothetical protein
MTYDLCHAQDVLNPRPMLMSWFLNTRMKVNTPIHTGTPELSGYSTWMFAMRWELGEWRFSGSGGLHVAWIWHQSGLQDVFRMLCSMMVPTHLPLTFLILKWWSEGYISSLHSRMDGLLYSFHIWLLVSPLRTTKTGSGFTSTCKYERHMPYLLLMRYMQPCW